MPLNDKLQSLATASDALAESLDDGRIRCLSCAHGCTMTPGESGICRMRFNRDGRLYVPHGYIAGIAVDPIEKKPFYHVLPGEKAFSFGMLGCNFHCEFCQNWVTSQALRDAAAGGNVQTCTARDLVNLAQSHGCRIVSSTYNEPLITSEWAVDVFRLAKSCGMTTTYVSNGFASMQVLDFLDPWLDAMNVDLKCFTEDGYRRLGGRLQPVLDTIRSLHDRGKWIEIVTLIVPGFNDSDKELREIAEFVASVDPDIPWHVTAYHAAYKMSGGARSTAYGKIMDAIEFGRNLGLRHVYGGNFSKLGDNANTHCSKCGATLVSRSGWISDIVRLRDGKCPSCGQAVPGRWGG